MTALRARDVGVRLRGRDVLDGVDVDVLPGRTTAVVGESGAGKTTLVRVLAGLRAPDRGRVSVDDVDLRAPSPRVTQLVPQDPYGSLNPLHRVGRIVGQPLTVHHRVGRREREEQVGVLLASVGLDPALAARRPAALSGGQRQRVAFARALAVRPALLLLDEPFSALDADTADGLLDLLRDLREREGLGYLLVSHDLDPVERLADDVVVLRAGRVVESGPVADVLGSPRHAYTRALVRAGRGDVTP